MSMLAVSHIALWVVTLGILVTLLGVLRQLGVLFERVAPMGAMMSAAAASPGMAVGPLSVETVTGRPFVVGGPRKDKRAQLLLFVAPGCPLCADLLSLAPKLARSEASSVEFALVGDGDNEELRKYAAKNAVSDLPMLRDPELARTFQIAKLPYAVIIDATGLLVSSGLVNTREHLESLIVAVETGEPSIQSYFDKQNAPGESAREMVTTHGS